MSKTTTNKMTNKKTIQGHAYNRVTTLKNDFRCPASDRNYPWPEFNNDKERIKANTERYRGVPVSEAMCGIKTTTADQAPVAPEIGQVFMTNVHYDSGTARFDGINIKESIACRNNLKRYFNAGGSMFRKEVPAKVVAINKPHQEVVVDLLQPTFEQWIKTVTKDKSVQYDMKHPQTITVKNLQLSNGGYLGKALIPCMKELTGEDYYVDAFIPGSQIVLNIEKDFEKWNGKDVETFITNYSLRPGSVNQMSLICSRKAVLNFDGNKHKIALYNKYCDDDEVWKAFTDTQHGGIVTGVINSSKKCGVFVEIPSLNITGMVNTTPEKLVEYKAGQNVKVRIIDFEKMLTYDTITQMMVHQDPYVIEDGKLKSCILKPVLVFA